MSDREIDEVVPEPMVNQRLDRFVAMAGDVSRRDVAEMIAGGQVSVNGETDNKPSRRLLLGDVVTARVPVRDHRLSPDPEVEIVAVHVDDDVVVVDKPPGLVIHPGAGVDRGTLAHGLLARFPEIVDVGDDQRRPGIVHRLDKGTSGLIMVARTQRAFEGLTQQLADRSVHRRYLAVVWGDLDSSEGLIDAPLGRSPREATKQTVLAGGRPARTRYDVLERFVDPECALLACQLETGRTHQIRVHLEAIGHPVIGDDRYGPRRADEQQELLGPLDRPFLHAASLGFHHPVSDEWLEFESPLPPDLEAVLARFRAQR